MLERVLLSLGHCLSVEWKNRGFLPVCNSTTGGHCSVHRSKHSSLNLTSVPSRIVKLVIGPLWQAAPQLSAYAAPRRHTSAKPRSADPLQALVARALARAGRQPRRTPHGFLAFLGCFCGVTACVACPRCLRVSSQVSMLS